MAEWCWLNGKVTELSKAKVGVEDRGFLFADGVYEAVRLYGGVPFELNRHMDRLERSCGGIRLKLPMPKARLASEMLKLVKKSRVRDGFIYLQVTRGEARRSHIFPKRPLPTVFFFIRKLPPVPGVGKGKPYTLMSITDERWNKCWIKSIALLENTLARTAAADAGADEAIFIHNGIVTEGTTSNIFVVLRGKLITHPLGPKVLPGVTRDVLIECARSLGMEVQERGILLEEAKRSEEVFVTSSTRELVWASRWDEATIGDGSCGPVATKLHEAYRARVIAATTTNSGSARIHVNTNAKSPRRQDAKTPGRRWNAETGAYSPRRRQAS